MLIHLAIRDFTIIHRLDVDLGAGLTALTGETGAGKSILVDALGLALGGRASGDLVRPGAGEAEVTATFDPHPDLEPELAELRGALGLGGGGKDGGEDGNEYLILRRRVSRDGRSRAWVDDSPVSARVLRDLGARLVDLQGQHSHHALLRPAHQLRILDAASGAGHGELAARTAELHRELAAVEAELEAARAGGDEERERRAEYLRYQCNELEALAARPGEADELGAELRRLAHAVEVRAAADEIEERLTGGERASDSLLHGALKRLADIERRLPETTAAARELLEAALVHVAEAGAAVHALVQGIDTDPARVAAVEERLAALHDAARKHRVDPDGLAERLAALQAELEALESSEGRVLALEARRKDLLERYGEAAARLRASREKTAGRLAGEVTKRMHELGIEGGEFLVSMHPAPEPRATGLDDVEFRVRTNPGHPPASFARIASGGEQSRIALGILVSTRGGLPVMVFDEIDTGVGGRVAELVGRYLRKLADGRQVLCVTHLPQVASQARSHLVVHKRSDGDGTSIGVQGVDGEERTREIARMMAGEEITAESLAHAHEMLGAVRRAAGADA